MKNLFIIIVFLAGVFFSFSQNSTQNNNSMEGVSYYYGIEDYPQDYQKAMEIFEQQNDDVGYIFLSLMYLNGDGLDAPNPEKAKQIVDMSKNAIQPLTKSELLDKIKIISENIEKGIPSEKIDYCNIAMTTIDINLCANINILRAVQERNDIIHTAEKKLNNEQKQMLRIINSNLEIILAKDANRVYKTYFGSGRGVESSLMSRLINTHYQEMLQRILIEQDYPSYSKKDYAKAKRLLNKAIKQRNKQYKEEVKDEVEEFYDIKKVNALLKEAQQVWIDYRDEWVRLVLSIEGDNNTISHKDLALSLKTMLIELRIEEIHANYDKMIE